MNYERGTGHSPVIHLCDFDGTLTHEDSFVRFLWFAVPLPGLLGGGIVLIFRFLALIISGQWSKGAGKAAVLSVFFKGKTDREMAAKGTDFCQKKIPAMLRTPLFKQLLSVHQKGETVVIVSASPDLWLRPFCAEIGFGLLCTELKFVEGKFTGKFATPNCNGAEKALRIKSAYALHTFDKIMAYGNSKGDEAMFELATKVFKF